MKNFKLILKSLINNNACVEGGRSKRWWFAIIMVLISMILALVPTLVSRLNTKGDDFVKNSTNNYDVGVLRFSEALEEKGLEMTIETVNNEKKMVLKKGELTGQAAWDAAFEEEYNPGYHVYTHKNYDGKEDLQVFFISEDIASTNIREKYLNKFSFDEEGKEVKTARTCSFLVFGELTMRTRLYTSSGSASGNELLGDYKHFSDGYSFSTLGTIEIDGTKYHSEKAIKDAGLGVEAYQQYLNKSWNDWKDFLRVSYLNKKTIDLWVNLASLFGVNVAITFFMGLMLFILTRGKANPYRVYNFWETQKMVYWGTITPAVLALIVGFIPLFNIGQIIFPLLLGVRIMWMSMKSLNPQSGTPVFPKPEKHNPANAGKVKTVKAKFAK